MPRPLGWWRWIALLVVAPLLLGSLAYAQTCQVPFFTFSEWCATIPYNFNAPVIKDNTIFFSQVPNNQNHDPLTLDVPAFWRGLIAVPPWSSSVTYPPGTVVNNLGNMFTSNYAVTGGPGPASDRAAWRLSGNYQTQVGVPANADTNYVPALPIWTSPVNVTAALQAAITNAAPGATIQLGCGTYTINATLTINKAMTLQGCPSGGTTLNTSVGPAIQTAANFVTLRDFTIESDTASPLLRLNTEAGQGPTGVSIHDLRFSGNLRSGNGPSGVTQTAIQINSNRANSGRSQYYNLYFRNVYIAMDFTAGTDWNSVSNINFDGVEFGIVFDDGSGTGNVFSTINFVGTDCRGGCPVCGVPPDIPPYPNFCAIVPSVGILYKTSAVGVGDITFGNMQFGSYTVGMDFFPGSAYSERVSIINAQFDASNQTGIDMQGFLNVNIIVSTGGAVTHNLTGTKGVISLMGGPSDDKVTFQNMTPAGSAAGKSVVCVDPSTGQLYVSNSGSDCS